MSRDCLLQTASLPEFFRERISSSLHHLHVEASPDAEYYLVSLLTTFAQSESFFEKNEKGIMTEKPLALTLSEALAATPDGKIPLLKKMGDVALYVSGFFADSFLKKVVSADYYIHMGEVAYASVSQLLARKTSHNLKELYDELATNFPRFSDVLSDVAATTNLHSDKNILKIYERWLQTGSERAKNILMDKGLIPNETIKTGYIQ